MELPGSVWTIVGELHRAAQLRRRRSPAPLGPVPLAVLGLAIRRRSRSRRPWPRWTSRAGPMPSRRPRPGRAERDRLCDELGARLTRRLAGWSEPELAAFAQQLTRMVSALAADVP